MAPATSVNLFSTQTTKRSTYNYLIEKDNPGARVTRELRERQERFEKGHSKDSLKEECQLLDLWFQDLQDVLIETQRLYIKCLERCDESHTWINEPMAKTRETKKHCATSRAVFTSLIQQNNATSGAGPEILPGHDGSGQCSGEVKDLADVAEEIDLSDQLLMMVDHQLKREMKEDEDGENDKNEQGDEVSKERVEGSQRFSQVKGLSDAVKNLRMGNHSLFFKYRNLQLEKEKLEKTKRDAKEGRKHAEGLYAEYLDMAKGVHEVRSRVQQAET